MFLKPLLRSFLCFSLFLHFGGANLLDGVELEKLDSSKVKASEGFAGKLVGFFFAAHFCPYCRNFSPVLKEFYENTEVKENLEIVFVSFDHSEEDLKGFMRESHGDWYFIPFGSDVIGKLSKKYEILGIPTLVIVNSNGTEVTRDGYEDVENSENPVDTIEKWKKVKKKMLLVIEEHS